MKTYTPIAFGWRYNQGKNRAVIRKKSQLDFFLSIIIAFLIIFIISQCLSYLDQVIRTPYKNVSLNIFNPLQVNTANAASEEALKLIQSHREINIIKGKGFTFKVGFKNQGNQTWQQKGAGRVELKIAPPYTRETVIRHKFWRDEATPAWLNDAVNKPGWIGFYRFAVEAPTESGVYTESFVLVRNGNEIISGSQFDIVINVWNSEADFQNKKTVAKNSLPIKNTQPVIQPSAQPVNSENNNQEYALAQKCLDLKGKKLQIAVSVTVAEIDECKTINIDLTDRLVEPLPEPTPEPVINNNTSNITTSSSDGPDIRIGLFSTTDPIIIKSSAGYKIKDQHSSVLNTASANTQLSFNFDFTNKLYNHSAGTTSSYLRLESDSGSNVFEIVSYENRPGWNQSLNDNKFLGDLEIRYSPNTGKLWVINELPLETYLKGLAESSNSSPMEYQKALIIAARTYATHHLNKATKHANEYFILDAHYDQVYKGYGSQIRLTQVSEAVEATKGIVVTYNNEIAITPYFSYSDGRTRDWSEVWGGDVPWCKGVAEPAGYDKTTMYGHGVGLSAYGAIMLANDYGYNYEQILKYYFTGIELKNNY